MPTITLPDGKSLEFTNQVTGLQIAEKIGKSLAKQAMVISVDGKLRDLNFVIEKDCSVKIFTSKNDEGLETIRHDTAHILAMAVQELYPGTQVTIGPVIENGFYYDFARKEPFTEDDLKRIEEKMREIVDRNEITKREVWSRDKAIKHFKNKGEFYKAQLIESIPEGEEVSIYFHGEWHDLCRGPHLSSTGKIGKFFKLTKVAGAYWRGDSNNEMLQRIYGTSWASQKDLDDYLKRIEEAEKRDHRKLGKEMDLFHFREESPGSVFWHEKGWALFQKLIDYMRMKQDIAGYKEINTPEVLDRSLWEKSGHWEKFGANMYTSTTPDEKVFAIKPMNCPGCLEVFNQGLKSYKDLPLKMSEFGKVHRYEPSGALHGLLRVRAFTQDDAHIFCTTDQINDEVKTLLSFSVNLLGSYGLTEIEADLSTKPTKYIGSDKDWDNATNSLKQSLTELEVPFQTAEGEGAFYGPKIDLHAKDAIGRRWQLSTIQIDFAQPDNFDIEYVNSDNKKSRPVMIHRALLGSVERFTAVLLEHYAGNLPGWLSPIQIDVLTIGNVNEYAQTIIEDLKSYRVNLDDRNIRLGEKLHNSEKSKTPIQIIIGEKDASSNTMAVNIFGKENMKDVDYKKAINSIKKSLKEPEFSLDG